MNLTDFKQDHFLDPMIKLRGTETVCEIDVVSGEPILEAINNKEVVAVGYKDINDLLLSNRSLLVAIHPEVGPMDDLEIDKTITRPTFLTEFESKLSQAQLKRLNVYWATDNHWEIGFQKLYYELSAFDTPSHILNFIEARRDWFLNYHLKFFDREEEIELENYPHLVNRYKDEPYYDHLRMNRFLVEGIKDPIVMCARCNNVWDGKHRLLATLKRKKKKLRAMFVYSFACPHCSGLVGQYRRWI